MIAYCGLPCDTCPIYMATEEKDKSIRDSMRDSIRSLCNTKYGMDLTKDEITDCDGCRAGTGRIFLRCSECEIRNCAIGKNLESCATCTEYPCLKLARIFNEENAAKVNLDKIRAGHMV